MQHYARHGRRANKAGIPRRRHGHRHRDTDFLARKSRVSDVRMYKRDGRVGVGVGVVECEL